MGKRERKSAYLNAATLRIVGVIVALVLAIALLWHGNATSMQSQPALLAQVYFDGEYRIADGAWQEIVKGEHIPSTQGDVTLRGNFHMLAPDGEYIGIYTGDIPIALYTDHISLCLCPNSGAKFLWYFGSSPLCGRGVGYCRCRYETYFI